MAIRQLSEEEIRTWTLEQKDRWWKEKIFRGDMPQLTLRAALCGMLLGSILSLTNLYVGAKTGWTLGVGITSVILAFALFRVLARLGLAQEFTILENNCMQSIATSAGYMTGPLYSSLAAYMMVKNEVLPMAMVMVWLIALAVLGVLFAFPLKRRFINDEQHPFPEGRAAGVVMDALHSGGAQEGLFKAKLLAITGLAAAALKLFQSHAILDKLKAGFLTIPEHLDGWIYKLGSPSIRGVPLRELTVRIDSEFVLWATGGLMGFSTGVSLMVGACINYLWLAPWMIERGDIPARIVDGVSLYGFRTITTWSLWCGVAMMTTASLVAFFAKPGMLFQAFAGLFRRRAGDGEDVLRDIELPMKLFVGGIPLIGILVVYLAHEFFGIEYWLGAVAVPLVFVFTIIAAHSTALTAITPVGAMGKLTQLTYGIMAPKSIETNIMTAGITAEVTSNASNLLMDIKPGYMLGAKPRQQAIGHVIGAVIGSIAAVPVFYSVFLQNNPAGLVSEQYPMPSATVWKSVAELLTEGLGKLPMSARWAALYGGMAGIALEALRIATKGRFWLSGIGIGLAFVIPFNNCLGMFFGALFFWLCGKLWRTPESAMNRVVVQNQEPISAGIIAGGALMAIAVTVIEVFLLSD
jgi:putative OPT family oligopeptide transporter